MNSNRRSSEYSVNKIENEGMILNNRVAHPG